MRKKLLGFFFILISISGFGQSSSKGHNYFAEPIMTDNLSTIMIPVKIDVTIINSSKIGYGEYYSNVIFYDYKTDSSKRLFKDDTFIKGFQKDYNYYNRTKADKLDYVSSNWIFYFVKSNDYSRNGKIDSDDPYILYVSDKKGNGLKPITSVNENAVSIDVYYKQGFALIKMQRDLDKDNDFESDDKDFYYIRLDLNTLTLGNKIEIKN
jgi:hypothetical protein